MRKLLKPILTALFVGAVFSAYAAPATKVFTVTNSGNGALTLGSPVIAGNLTDYTVTANTCGTPVAPGGSCTFTVSFAPAAVGVRPPASLVLSSNGSTEAQSITLTGSGAPGSIPYTISSNAVDVNVAALFGNPTAAGNYVLTIDSGVYVTASSTAKAALTTGSFPAGSTLKIVNNGFIVGKGGAGGVGGSVSHAGTSAYCYYQTAQPGVGQAGGPALSAQTVVSIDNTSGYIYGGGGGGGGTQGSTYYGNCGAGGNGGGGGAGSGVGGAGGSSVGDSSSFGVCNLVWNGDVSTGNWIYTGSWGAYDVGGHPGQTPAAGSGAGAGGALLPIASGNPNYYAFVAGAGSGGDYGQPGQAGGVSYQYSYPSGGCSGGAIAVYAYAGAPGGAGGAAVLGNGNSISWVGGNTSTQVKGAVLP